MKGAPCKDCEYRHAYCHANCVIYKDWAIARREETLHTSAERNALNNMWDYGGRKK